ncbi:ATP-binding cassette domain-containing protein [Aliiglaciecola sp. LCG003]|uniref:ABC transporter ATP-binding protein n=1 Tax=Aliiglaciecola sp. LCG003 TaxID=3053655 RepID=UPI002572D1B2|nr:ATP-binding cassette domain-containing protein [Aliiglaciecola sp. LCG003]WJG08514.1 ATP-binding cassette domain-containing protein [Aliiglaciecola sp. LCG003]
MIYVNKLSKMFGDFVAVDNLTFNIQPGDVVGFLGPNGAGKSTTMKMLTGFLTPSQGDIQVFDQFVSQDAKKIQQKIGYLPEGAPAYGDMTPLQFLHFIAKIRGLKGQYKKDRINRVIQQVELQSVLDKPIDNLSKGFKRRVGLAQAILHDPEILILDEPTDGLDPNQKHQVRGLIQNLSKDKIVIISTHILEEVTAVCNRVMIISAGKLMFDDTPNALLQKSKYYKAVTLHLSYPSDTSGFLELPGIIDIEEERSTGRVTLLTDSGADVLHMVTQHIKERRLPVDTLYVEQGRLDQVFRDMTQGVPA